MSELVDRVAQAIEDAMASDDNSPEDLARAAIKAMRAPDKKMLKAACAAMSPDRRPTQKRVSVKAKHGIRYRAMIDAALSEEARGDG